MKIKKLLLIFFFPLVFFLVPVSVKAGDVTVDRAAFIQYENTTTNYLRVDVWLEFNNSGIVPSSLYAVFTKACTGLDLRSGAIGTDARGDHFWELSMLVPPSSGPTDNLNFYCLEIPGADVNIFTWYEWEVPVPGTVSATVDFTGVNLFLGIFWFFLTAFGIMFIIRR